MKKLKMKRKKKKKKKKRKKKKKKKKKKDNIKKSSKCWKVGTKVEEKPKNMQNTKK